MLTPDSGDKNNLIIFFANCDFFLQTFWIKSNLITNFFFNGNIIFNLFIIKKNKYFDLNLGVYNYNNLNTNLAWNLYKPLFFFFLLKNLNYCMHVLYCVSYIKFFNQLKFHKKIDVLQKIFFFSKNLKTL
jgi:hypothetical protein